MREAKLRATGINRTKRLVKAAGNSIGVKDSEAVRRELWQMMKEYELLKKQLNDTMQIIEDLILQIPGADCLLRVPGAGVITVASYLLEEVDIGVISFLYSRRTHQEVIQ